MRVLLDECLPRRLRDEDLRPLMPRVLELLAQGPRPGTIVRVEL